VDGDWTTSNDPLLELPLDLQFRPTFVVEVVPGKFGVIGGNRTSSNNLLELLLDSWFYPTFMGELAPDKLVVGGKLDFVKQSARVATGLVMLVVPSHFCGGISVKQTQCHGWRLDCINNRSNGDRTTRLGRLKT
jgi:hypothetical protein